MHACTSHNCVLRGDGGDSYRTIALFIVASYQNSQLYLVSLLFGKLTQSYFSIDKSVSILQIITVFFCQPSVIYI